MPFWFFGKRHPGTFHCLRGRFCAGGRRSFGGVSLGCFRGSLLMRSAAALLVGVGRGAMTATLRKACGRTWVGQSWLSSGGSKSPRACHAWSSLFWRSHESIGSWRSRIQRQACVRIVKAGTRLRNRRRRLGVCAPCFRRGLRWALGKRVSLLGVSCLLGRLSRPWPRASADAFLRGFDHGDRVSESGARRAVGA